MIRERLRARRGRWYRIRALSTILLAAGALVLLTPPAIRWYVERLPDEPPPLLLATPQGVIPAQEPPDAPPVSPTVTSGTGGGEPALAPPEPAEQPAGQPADPPTVGSDYAIEIPRLGARYPVVAGVGNQDLLHGPGHYPTTVAPGEPGNAAIAGHRTVRGRASFFYSLDRLQAGDEVRIVYPDRTVVFTVNRVFITDPFDLGVLDPTPEPTLTLTTCDPPGLDTNRLIVQAGLAKVE